MSLSSTSRSSGSGAHRGGAPAGANRLPPSRERRPALAALAVILILLGAAGSALIALRSGDREYYVAVSRDLAQGTKIKRSDLARASLAGDTASLIPWSEADKLIDHYTTVRLAKNQLPTRSSFSEGNRPDVPPNGALVGLALGEGQLPSDGVEGGDIVQLIRVPANANDASPEVLVRAAEVTIAEDTEKDKDTTNDNDAKKVTVLVPADTTTKVAAAAAAKTIVLVKLPDNTKPVISSQAGG